MKKIVNFQCIRSSFQVQNVSGGAINPGGGSPVWGSDPLGLLKSRMWG